MFHATDEVGSDVEQTSVHQDDDSNQPPQNTVASAQKEDVGEEGDAQSDATSTDSEDCDNPDDGSHSDHPDIRGIIPIVPLRDRIDTYL